jgi:hypothetical protein
MYNFLVLELTINTFRKDMKIGKNNRKSVEEEVEDLRQVSFLFINQILMGLV